MISTKDEWDNLYFRRKNRVCRKRNTRRSVRRVKESLPNTLCRNFWEHPYCDTRQDFILGTLRRIYREEVEETNVQYEKWNEYLLGTYEKTQ